MRNTGGGSPEVSVIVLAYTQVDRLDAVLQQLDSHDCGVDYEVIVIANAVGADVSEVINNYTYARRVDARVNRGFGGGCNLGAKCARGEYLVFLNDDAIVRDGWLDALVSIMRRYRQVGAAASVLVDRNDVVLEAGGAVNHVGEVWPPDRGRPLGAIQGRGHRKATYATGGSLIVRRDVFAAVGGFDFRYHPAYFEDADLSCRIWAAGHEVWTTTSSVVEHAESASTSGPMKRALQLRNGMIFRGRWMEEFGRNVLTLRPGEQLPMPNIHRVLFIDDRTPAHGVGSGAARSRQNMLAIASGGSSVLFHPREPSGQLDSELLLAGIELVPDLDAVVPGSVQAVVISRPHNYVLWDGLVEQHPGARFIYDAEARFSARMERQLELNISSEDRVTITSELEEMIELERRIVVRADAVVAISTEEKTWFESCNGGSVHWVDPMPDQVAVPTNSLRDPRRIVLVAGWEAGEFSPNGDAVKWLAKCVVPLLIESGVDFLVEVTGAGVPTTLRSLESNHLKFIGRVDDLDGLHRSARLAIAPTRYGAGVKLKVIDALRNGTPVVASTVGAEGIADMWRSSISVADEPAEFARSVQRLLSDDHAWARAHEALVAAAQAHCASAARSWTEVLGRVAQDRDLSQENVHVAR